MLKKTKELSSIAQTLLLLLVLASVVTGCDSPFSDMSDMKNTTAQMAGTTQGMAQTTDDLDAKTAKILDLTGLVQDGVANTYFGMRQGNSAETRADMLAKMDQATTIEAKIAKASIYFEGFEYQLWTGTQKDSANLLDRQYLDAMQQFDREITQYVPSDLKVDPTSKDNKMMNLYALAVTMHLTNELEINQPVLPQDDPSQTKPYKVSMMDLIKSCLRAEKSVYGGTMNDDAETDWQTEGASNQPLFAALVQTRENFLSVMTLAKISDIAADTGFLGIPGLVREGKMLLAHWNSKIPSLNIEQLKQYKSWLDESISNRDFLKGLEADASLNSSVEKIYSNMNEPGTSALVKSASPEATAAAKKRSDAGTDLWMDIQNLIKG